MPSVATVFHRADGMGVKDEGVKFTLLKSISSLALSFWAFLNIPLL